MSMTETAVFPDNTDQALRVLPVGIELNSTLE
jgi:hypothetical protein